MNSMVWILLVFFLFIHALKMKRFLFLFLFGSNIEIAHLTVHLTLPALNTSDGDKKRIWEPFEHSKSQIVIILLLICLSFVRAIKSHNPQPFHNWHIEPLFNMFYSRWNLDNIKNNFFCIQLRNLFQIRFTFTAMFRKFAHIGPMISY